MATVLVVSGVAKSVCRLRPVWTKAELEHKEKRDALVRKAHAVGVAFVPDTWDLHRIRKAIKKATR